MNTLWKVRGPRDERWSLPRCARLAAVALGLLAGCGRPVETGQPPVVEAGITEDKSLEYDAVQQRVRARQENAFDVYLLRSAVEKFQAEFGRSPKDFIELLETGYLDEMPAAPTGMFYEYNATNGMVRMIRIPGSSRAHFSELP